MSTNTRTATLSIEVEHRERPDGTTEIVAVRLGGSPVAMPDEAMNETLRFGLIQALVFGGHIDDEPTEPDPVIGEIDRVLG